MVRLTRASLAGTGAEVAVGDASAPDLPAASFDVVASSLVLFLPDPRAALARWVALLCPGGRIGVTTFGAQSGLWRELDGLLRPWMPPLDPRSAGPDGGGAAGDDGDLADVVDVRGGRGLAALHPLGRSAGRVGRDDPGRGGARHGRGGR